MTRAGLTALAVALAASTGASAQGPDRRASGAIVADAFVEATVICARALRAGVPVAALPAEDLSRLTRLDPVAAPAPPRRGRHALFGAGDAVVIEEAAFDRCDVAARGSASPGALAAAVRALDVADLGLEPVDMRDAASALTLEGPMVGAGRFRITLSARAPSADDPDAPALGALGVSHLPGR